MILFQSFAVASKSQGLKVFQAQLAKVSDNKAFTDKRDHLNQVFKNLEQKRAEISKQSQAVEKELGVLKEKYKGHSKTSEEGLKLQEQIQKLEAQQIALAQLQYEVSLLYYSLEPVQTHLKDKLEGALQCKELFETLVRQMPIPAGKTYPDFPEGEASFRVAEAFCGPTPLNPEGGDL